MGSKWKGSEIVWVGATWWIWALWGNASLGVMDEGRMVANKGWMSMFPEASVHHFSMSISDHCLLALSLKRSQPRKPIRKRFMFEAIWTREEGCKDVIEATWDPLRSSSVSSVRF
nr:hypothetical protein CFP56_41154 [Quercus suber]